MPANEGKNAAPLNILFLIYKYNNKPLIITQLTLDVASLKAQIGYLKSNEINTKSKRNDTVKIIQNNGCEDLGNPFMRLHLKYVLKSYYDDCVELKYKKLNLWTKHDIIVSLFSYFIEKLDEKKNSDEFKKLDKFCEFMYWVIKYMNEATKEELKFFDTIYANNQVKGWSLKFTKRITTKYELKAGPFAKVKTKCREWNEFIRKNNRNPPKKPVYIYNNNNNAGGGDASWYWYDDSNINGVVWVPYMNNDTLLLNDAWNNKLSECFVVNNRYTVKFDYNSKTHQRGLQYSRNTNNGNGRRIAYGKPINGLIDGIPVKK